MKPTSFNSPPHERYSYRRAGRRSLAHSGPGIIESLDLDRELRAAIRDAPSSSGVGATVGPAAKAIRDVLTETISQQDGLTVGLGIQIERSVELALELLEKPTPDARQVLTDYLHVVVGAWTFGWGWYLAGE